MTVFIGTIVVPKKGRVRGNGIISNKGDCLRRYSQHLLGTTNRSLIIFPIPPPPRLFEDDDFSTLDFELRTRRAANTTPHHTTTTNIDTTI